MTKSNEQALAALAVIGVAAAILLFQRKGDTASPGAPSGPLVGSGAGLPGGGPGTPYKPPEAADTGPEAPSVLSQVSDAVTGWLAALAGDSAPEPVAPGAYQSPAAYRMQYRPLFRSLEKSYAMPTGLLEGIADRESRFRHDIISGEVKGGVGEEGIMQLHPKYHLTSPERLDPKKAIPYAANYLAKQFMKFGTWDEAIAAYNWGPGNVERSGIGAAPKATKEYIAWIHDRDYVEGFV